MIKNCFNSWLYIESKICVYLCTKLNNTPCDVWRDGSATPRVGNLSTTSGTLSGEIYERIALNKAVNWGRGGKKISQYRKWFPPSASHKYGQWIEWNTPISTECKPYWVLLCSSLPLMAICYNRSTYKANILKSLDTFWHFLFHAFWSNFSFIKQTNAHVMYKTIQYMRYFKNFDFNYRNK